MCAYVLKTVNAGFYFKTSFIYIILLREAKGLISV